MRVIFFLSILCLFTKPTLAKEYYISPSGNDANDGSTTSTPWKSISKVSATTFQPGDKILLQAGGVWSGQLAPKGSGAAGSPIILDMYGVGNKPIINGPASDLSAGFSLTDQSYWNVNNLEITNKQAVNGTARLCGIWVKATLPAGLQNVQIRNCYVHDVNSLTNESNSSFNKLTGGIIFTGYTNEILVKGCRIANVSVEGIRNNSDPQKCEHFVIDSNSIENVYGDGIVYHGVRNNSAITRNICKNVSYNTSNANYAGIWTYLSDTTLVAYNEVYGITGGGVNDGQPFDADINTNGDIFEYNYTHDNAKGFMLFMPSAKNIIVRFNVSVNDIGNVSNNKDLFNYTVTTNNNNKIYNNTFYINANTVTQIFRTGFIGEFSNNILYCTGAVGKFSQAAVKTSSVFNNNCFYPQSITTTNGPAGTMTGNIYLNPRFINAGIHNTGIKGGEQNAYSLNIYSPCLNKGAVISANGNMDYTGTNISGITPSIGAIWPTTYTQWVAKTVPVLEDAYTFDGSSTTNFGKATTLLSKFGGGFAPEGTATANGYSRRTYLKFSTAALKNNTSALNRIYIRVRYYAKDNNYPVNGIKISMSKRTSWVETGITWNTQSTAAGVLDSLGYTLDDGYVKQSTAPNPITPDLSAFYFW